MHEKDLDGRILRVELSRPEAAGKLKNYDPNRMETKNLFIANIPNDATKEDVEDAFGKFGKGLRILMFSFCGCFGHGWKIVNIDGGINMH